MKTFPAETILPFPTPYMQGLFPALSVELDNLELLVRKELSIQDRADHERTLATLRDLLAANYAALALFLAHPTQRLSIVLLTEVQSAEAAVAWLLDNRPPQLASSGFRELYVACCGRLYAGVSNWQQSVDLKRMVAELEGWMPETVH